MNVSALLTAIALTSAVPRAGAAISDGSQAVQSTQPTRCFFRRQWTGPWKVTPDARTMYINVSGEIYRLDLAASYPLLKSPWAVLHNIDSSNTICAANDFRLSVTDQIGNWAAPIVRRLTLLSPGEAAALPKTLRP